MSAKMNKSVGFYVSAAATLLCLIMILLYMSVLRKNSLVYIGLAVAAVTGLIAVALSVTGKVREIYNTVLIVDAVSVLAAVTVSFGPMANDLALVYSGLNEFSIVQSFVFFAAAGIISWILFVVAAFAGMGRE